MRLMACMAVLFSSQFAVFRQCLIVLECFGVNARAYRKFVECRDESHSLSEWSRITGIAPTTIIGRLGRGWTPEQALGKTARPEPTNGKFIECRDEMHSVSEWSRITGISRNAIKKRLERGLSPERAIWQPVGGERRPSSGHSRRLRRTPTYSSWCSMLRRCQNPNDVSYPYYRSVKIAARWQNFRNFLADMGERPKGTTLDRYPNPAGNYEPGNCRWATQTEQANNRRNNHIVEFRGRRHTVAEWAEIVGIGRNYLYLRIRRMGPERALEQPLAAAHALRLRI